MDSSLITKLRTKFLREIGNHGGFPQLFENIDNISFFLKNSRFEILYANPTFYRRLGLSCESEVVGKEDFELFPKPLAEKFRHDDETLLKTGKPLPSMVELFLSQQGLPDWFTTNKVPVLNRKGKAVGVMGTVQSYDHNQYALPGDTVISRAANLILKTPEQVGSLQELARGFDISYRHFDRLFKEATGMTPIQFLGRSRITRACTLLRDSRSSIADISFELGYCDQSALTSQFSKHMGFTPQQYRKRYHKIG